MDSETFIQNFLSDELEHHGVKGMRWGHRKLDASSRTNGKTNKTNKTNKTTKTTKKQIKRMSDSEVQSRIKRLESEKKLSKLSKEDSNPTKQFIKSVMADSGKRVLTTVATNAMIGGVRYATDKSYSKKDFVSSLGKSGGKK